ncbi:Glu/Leu/Phe/Val dehydrogenase family protein [Microcella sp.]|uniref:Glu/Leu/Phe/Val dehydrogenase family protein n=1 Tax=Microcella sp. TaxID=1913979 RepID=UPI00256C210F|nr:Glu/Leu/Phe/Val dehydrogenase family protein [Microcella sp.]MBX9471620.1 Glu/Leu/Phe/Val dehydrogenase family protein [Microcella sp.]
MSNPAPLPDFTHERATTVTGGRSGLRITAALHSSALGPALGGCRLWTYDHWADGVADALRLAQAMTMKNALADIGAGGGKAVIALSPGDVLDEGRRRDALLDLGDLVESFDGAYITTEDVGVTEHDMAVVREQTRHVVGLPAADGGAGEPAAGTALGVFVSIEQVLLSLFGSADITGRSFVIAGLGQVGSRLARRLADAGAVLTVTDINPSALAIADQLGATWIEAADAVTAPADVFVPAGLGGILTAPVIEQLPVRAVCGPANNPLAERSGADALAARGILYAPDYVVNAGGVIHLALTGRGDSPADVEQRIRAIGGTLSDVLGLAALEGITPLDAADRIAHARVAAARA